MLMTLWRRVGLAVERAGLAVEDKDRNRGIYLYGRARRKKVGEQTEILGER